MSIKQAIFDKIQEFDTIIIHRHQKPDPDALGSQGGLYHILCASFPQKKIYKVGGPVGDLAYLLTMDEIADDVYHDALVIVTDTANHPRISDQRYHLGKYVIKMDHHPDYEPYGDLSLVDTQASSASELIYYFYQHFKTELVLNDQAARLLYAGIVGDTGRFLYPATTSATFLAAAELRRYAFDAALLGRQMEEQSLNVLQLSGYLLEHIQMDQNGAGMVVITKETLAHFELSDEQTHSIVPLLGKVKGMQVWGVFVEQPDGHFRARLRSKGPTINQIAYQHGGGGHPLASGANAVDMNEVTDIYQKLQALVTNH